MNKAVDEVSVKQVEIKDDFWSQMQEKVIDIVIPFQEKVLRDEVRGLRRVMPLKILKLHQA